MTRASSDLQRAAVKTATRLLLCDLGGVEAASTVTRVVASKLHGYGSSQLADRNMPADVVLDLEACLGRPVVTAELARLAGYALMPLSLGDGDVAIRLAALSRGCGITMADAAVALADGLPPADVDGLLQDLVTVLETTQAAIAALRALQTIVPANPHKRRSAPA